MAALRELFAHFGFSFDDAKLANADKGVTRLKAGVDAVVAVFAGSALTQGVNRFAAELDVLDDLSAQTKIATDDLQLYGYAARLSGSSAEEMNAALTRLQMGLGRTEKATSPQAAALKSLGVAIEDAAGDARPLRDVLPEVFANFNTLGSEAKKAEVATALFGRAGVRMIPTLDRGAEGLAAYRSEMEKLGGPVSEDAIAGAGAYRDSLVKLEISWTALKGRLATSVFPILEKTVTQVAHGVGVLSNWVKTTTLADSATYALAGTIGVKLFGALQPFLGAGLKFGALFLAFDDFIGFLRGKDSLIGEIIDGWFGEGAADGVREFVNTCIGEFERFRTDAGAAFAAIQDSGDSTWTKLAASAAIAWNDMARGFPILNAGWDALVANMSLAWAEFMANFSSGYDTMIRGLNAVGKFFGKEGDLVDPADRKGDVDAAKARKSQADKSLLEVWDRTAAGHTVRRREQFEIGSGADTRQIAGNQAIPGGGPFNPVVSTPAWRMPGGTDVQRVTVPGAPANAPPVYAPVSSTTTNHFNIKGDNPAAIRREVEAVLKSQNRAAETALTQRGGG